MLIESCPPIAAAILSKVETEGFDTPLSIFEMSD